MKEKYIAKRYWKDKSTPMGQVDELAKKYSNVIDLSLGDPDITTHEDIIDFAFNEAKKGHTKYTDFRGDPELRTEISNSYFKEFGVTVKDEQIMVTTSACLGMYLALEAVLDPGDEVIIHAPYFTPYYQQIELAGGVPVELATYEEDKFQLDITRLTSLITERTKVIILNSPNNPTGAVLNYDTLNQVVKLAIERNIVIISDEIYVSYVYNEEFISLIEFKDIRKQLIILNSYSKDYTMTGWRVGHMISTPEIIKTCQLINENVVFTAPSISQRAALYALRNKDYIQETFVDLYKERVFYAYERINKIAWMSVLKPQGTFYLFINIKKTGLTSAEVSGKILDETQVLTIPGNAFGHCGEGYIRIACTVSVEVLKEAFDKIEKMAFN